jgi:deoxyadenosine/deoxycytidine kinase
MENSRTALQWIIVEGNVGAGKSTFLKTIQQHVDVGFVFEPHEQWQQVGNAGNILKNFYENPSRWAYTFESYAFITRIIAQQRYTQTQHKSTCILERSVFSDRYCFAKNAHEAGYMSELEWHLYCECFAWLVEHYMPKPAGFIYLSVDPIICLERIRQRDRHEESQVSLTYLQQLHEKHEAWLIHKQEVNDSLRDIPVLVIDGNIDFEHNRAQQYQHATDIMNFFNRTSAHHKNSIAIKPVTSLLL